jgi:hypothetical protein
MNMNNAIRLNYFIKYRLTNTLLILVKTSFLFVLLLFVYNNGYSQTTTDSYTSSGTWVCPAGVTSATVETWGAGGGGGSRTSGSAAYGGGGGGAYSVSTINVTPGTTYYLSVGSGGTSGGSNGGNSWFNASTTNPYTSTNTAPTGIPTGILAAGGASVPYNTTTGGAGGLASASYGATKYSGGTGGTSGGGYSGGGGGAAGSTGAGGNGGAPTAGLGTANNGGNGGLGISSNGNGNAGNNYGGGGSGALRTGGSPTGGTGAGGYVTITYVPLPMSFTSCTTTQANVTSLAPGATNQEIIGIQIVTSGSGSPLSATSFTVNANGSTNIADINAINSADIYYTGTSSTFATTTFFGQSTPTIANYNITGSQILSPGTNYFWLVYDIQSGATIGDFVDAECTSLTVTSARIPTITAPAGNRQIAITYCTSTSTGGSSYFNAFSTTGGITNITNNASGYSASGYGNFTAMSCSQSLTNSINFTTTLVGTTVGVNIWVDWNRDGDFADAGEKVYASGGYVSTSSGSFSVPATATAGSTRMRIRLDYNSTDPAICGSITRGETEDYTFIVTSPCVSPPSCANTPSPANGAINVGLPQTITWPAVSGATSYDVYFGTINPPSFYANVTSASFSPPLSTSTTYYWYVVPKNFCGSASGCNGTVWSFTTASFCTGYAYRTRATGNWSDYTNVWQVSLNGGAWANVTTLNSLSPYYPTGANSSAIEICTAHTISANVVISPSNTVVDYGGTLFIPAGNYSLTYSAGKSLRNEGTVTISAGGSASCSGTPPCANKWDGYGLVIDGGIFTNNYTYPDTNQLWINSTGVLAYGKTTNGSLIINNGYINDNGGYYYWSGGVGGTETVQWSGLYYYGADHTPLYTATFNNYGYVSNYSATSTLAGWYRAGLASFYDLNNYGTYGNFNTRAATSIYHNFINYNGGTVNNGSNFTTYAAATNHGTFNENWATNIDNGSLFTNSTDGVFNIYSDGAIRIETSTTGGALFTNDGTLNNNCLHAPSNVYGIDLYSTNGATTFKNSSTGIVNNNGPIWNTGTLINNGTITNDNSSGYGTIYSDYYSASYYGTVTNNNIINDKGIIYNGQNTTFTNTIGSQFIYQANTGSITSYSGSDYLIYQGTALLDYNGSTAQTTSLYEWPIAANVPRYVKIDNSSGTANGVTLNSARTIANLLTLTNGALKLNANTLTISNPSTTAINVTNGYVVSEQNSGANISILSWNCGTTIGSFIFPFGASDGSYIPVTFNKTTATGSNVSISTRATASNDNTPLPTFPMNVTNMNCIGGTNGAVPTVIDRWWEITPTVAVPADITFSYRGVENTTADPTSELAVQHWKNASSCWNDGKGGANGSYIATGINGVTSGVSSVTASGINEYSPFVLVLKKNTLPVELLLFNATCKDSKSKINWATASETNNDFFTLEKSHDANLFENLTTIPGAGNSNSYSSYTYTDFSPYSDITYYRLKQTDFNGTSTYSDIINSSCSNTEQQLSLELSFVNNEMSLNIINGKTGYALSIFEASGKLVYSNNVKIIDQQSQQLIISGELFSPGLYFIQLQSEDENLIQKFMVR